MLNSLVALLKALMAPWMVLAIVLFVTLYAVYTPRIMSFFVTDDPHQLSEAPTSNQLLHWHPPSGGERNEGPDDEEGFECKPCKVIFYREEVLHKHRAEHHKDRYCAGCRRMYKSSYHLGAHLRSSLHISDSVSCVAGCGKTFRLGSAMWVHVQRGGCPTAVTALADAIANLIEVDVHNIIVKPGIQLSDVRTERWMVPDDMRDLSTKLWHCHMCNKTTKERWYMQAHLDSGMHDRNVFHCPDSRCDKESSTISTLMKHWETAECRGHSMARNAFRGRN